jgi:succinate-acetate transporter protein
VLWIADFLEIGLAQFIAGIKGFEARDTLVTVVNTMWGSFWLAIGILYAFTVSLIAFIFYGRC